VLGCGFCLFKMLSTVLDATTFVSELLARRALETVTTLDPAQQALDWVQNTNQYVLAGVALPTGLILCFWGAKLFKYLMFVIGFLVAGYGSYVFFLNFQEQWKLSVNVVQYTSLGLGVLGGLLCFCLYRFSLFLIGALASTIGGQFLFKFISNYVGDLNSQAWIQIVFVALIGLIGGLIMLKLAEWLMKPFTAFVGAFLMMAAGNFFYLVIADKQTNASFVNVVSFFGKEDSYKSCNNVACYLSLSLWALFTILGSYYQITQHAPWGEEDRGRKKNSLENYHQLDDA